MVAALMSEEEAIGWFQGRMEFGPRALGSRSIIGDATSSSLAPTLCLSRYVVLVERHIDWHN